MWTLWCLMCRSLYVLHLNYNCNLLLQLFLKRIDTYVHYIHFFFGLYVVIILFVTLSMFVVWNQTMKWRMEHLMEWKYWINCAVQQLYRQLLCVNLDSSVDSLSKPSLKGLFSFFFFFSRQNCFSVIHLIVWFNSLNILFVIIDFFFCWCFLSCYDMKTFLSECFVSLVFQISISDAYTGSRNRKKTNWTIFKFIWC